MSSSSSSLAELIRSGNAPQNLKQYAAQGVLPLPPEELIPLQVLLAEDKDPTVSAAAEQSLAKFPEDQWMRLVEQKDPDRSVVLYCITGKASTVQVKEKILLNHSIPDDIVQMMAATETGHLLDVIINNQVRLLREPRILAQLEQNRTLTADQRRRIEEYKTEFILKKKPETEAAAAPELASLDDILAQIPNLDLEAQKIIAQIDAEPQVEPTDEEVRLQLQKTFSTDELKSLPEEIMSTYQRILKMKHTEKIRVALLGNKEERTLLIRDPSRQIASMVLRNPKLTESEMDAFSQMRNIDSDLLRQMGQSRDFLKRYNVVHSLVKNPKTPSPISLNLLKLLREMDLKNIERDKNIPEVIRRQAKKFRDMKELKKDR